MADKPVVSTAGGLTISDDTKKKMTDLQSSAKALSSPKQTMVPIESTDPTELLGGIYDLMLQQRTLELERRKHQVEMQLEEKLEQDQQNKLLLEALTGEKEGKKAKPAPKKAKKKKTPKKSAGGLLEAAMGAAVVSAAVQDKSREEAKVEKPKVPEPTPAPKPTAPPPEAVPTPTPAAKPSAEKVPTEKVPGNNKELVVKSLDDAGFSKMAKANVLANVEEESKFKPRSEELDKYSAKTLFKMYGPPGVDGGQPSNGKNKVRFQSLQEAQSVVSAGPEAIGDVIYGGRMGNTEKGDGYKYRGRGFIQLTGKDNYAKMSKALGVDLVSKPDLANEPQIAAKIVPLFFTVGRKKPPDLENIDTVNTIVGSASEKSREERKKLALAYSNEPASGTQLASSSETNKDLKGEMKRDKEASMIAKSQSTTINQTQTAQAQPSKDYDDRPVWQKKTQVA